MPSLCVRPMEVPGPLQMGLHGMRISGRMFGGNLSVVQWQDPRLIGVRSGFKSLRLDQLSSKC